MERAEAVKRWRTGHIEAERRQRVELAREGAHPERAVAEAIAALEAIATMGLWPAPRDPVAARAVDAVRRRWVRIETRAKAAARAAGQ
jgi:hypothetical protein